MTKSIHSYPIHGLYAITDSRLITADNLVNSVEQAIHGGASIIQYRDKTSNKPLRMLQAMSLLEVCRKHGIPLIINDDVTLVKTINANGVHLGKGDISIQQARGLLGEEAIIGTSCYNKLELATAAQEQGADYVAFGRFFKSHTKPSATRVDPDLLSQAKMKLDIPLVAIGGITPQNGAELITAGADALAVIHGVFGQADIRAIAQKYTQLFAYNEKDIAYNH